MGNPLNPALFGALRKLFGRVKISDRGAPMKWQVIVDHKTKRPKIDVYQGGEQYSVDCPFCHDLRGRLVIAHGWLTRPYSHQPAIAHTLRCYHEQCKQVFSTEFQLKVRSAMSSDADCAFLLRNKDEVEIKPIELRLPRGLIPLQELPADHAVHAFLARQYNGITAKLLGETYYAAFASEYDDFYRSAQHRVIFPIFDNGELLGWQGRRIDDRTTQKWYMNPGFHKVFYRAETIGPLSVPIICEGITSSIACGHRATAIFGKTLDARRVAELAMRWPTAILALDADAYIEDPQSKRAAAPEMKANIDEALASHNKPPCHLFRWPDDVMEKARRKILEKEDVKVPDAADFGIEGMRQLLAAGIPGTHRSLL